MSGSRWKVVAVFGAIWLAELVGGNVLYVGGVMPINRTAFLVVLPFAVAWAVYATRER
jgi:hypothetical protein